MQLKFEHCKTLNGKEASVVRYSLHMWSRSPLSLFK